MVKSFICYDILGGVVSLFVLIICIVVLMREKDDYFNWVLGGVVSGVLIGFSSKFF